MQQPLNWNGGSSRSGILAREQSDLPASDFLVFLAGWSSTRWPHPKQVPTPNTHKTQHGDPTELQDNLQA
eukprot:3836389-Rhodomonas_salina.1